MPAPRRRQSLTKTKAFSLRKGLMLETPPLAVPDGALRDALNFEAIPQGGYRRVDGYERFDGRPLASIASYWILNFDAGTGAAIVEGNTVDDATTLASGVTLIDAVLTSGAWGVDAAGYLVLTAVTGVFGDNNSLKVGAGIRAVADGTTAENGAATDTDDATWSQDAIETQRALIGPVPGSGNIRGIFEHEDDIYAFRDNPLGTAGVLHKATTTGWIAVTLNVSVAFSLGTAEVIEGETLTQTGTTAVIKRVNVVSGSWGGSDAAGYLVLGTVSGGPYTAATVATTTGGSLTTDGAEALQTLPAGGRYETIEHNFYANEARFRVYGVNGVGPAWDFDGTDFSLIRTSNVVDAPEHLWAHYQHLFLTFATGSLQHSAPGVPADFTSTSGASEIGVGDFMTAIKGTTGGTLAVFGRDRTKILHGSSSGGTDTWSLKDLAEDVGAIEWTLQSFVKPTYLNDRGITSLDAVDTFGDFQSAVFTQNIERIISAKKGMSVASIVSHTKNQYRLFFNDNSGITVTFDGRKISGITAFLYAHKIVCTAHGKTSAGAEGLYFGDDIGFVYKIDSGTSFDGESIDALLSTNYVNCKSPSVNKGFKKLYINAEAPAGAVIRYQADYDYGSADVPTGLLQAKTMSGSGSLWDQANWDQFIWAEDSVSSLEGGLDGTAKNVSISISSSSKYTESYTIYDMTFNYTMRNLVR